MIGVCLEKAHTLDKTIVIIKENELSFDHIQNFHTQICCDKSFMDWAGDKYENDL